ncbi:hypothetical protein TSAR_008867 [Trichomalopsis sarcophagae]|uniref:Odorant receptor n=1 Tax=Trichomalopsis sarcophagae TaxID=543379 RepID=A0A232FC60_9HYME|nr:hypothetical protein TSAR_008867 [Trichomalopsis sarcophagae]
MMNLLVLPLVTNGENRTLPMNVWLPYPVDSDTSYWLTYSHQTLGTLLLGTGAVGSTLMINGFMHQVRCQFEILSSRFQKLPQIIKRLQLLKKPNHLIYEYEKKSMKLYVQHHLYIFRVADTINDIFKSVIFQQFCISSIVVSASIFQLSTRPDKDMEFIMVFCYLICVLVEFLIYSWFGNELMLESLNFQKSVYQIDWTALSIGSGKDLVFIMMRASKPVIMYCGHFIILSLESYLGILKASYSVFNILRRSSN